MEKQKHKHEDEQKEKEQQEEIMSNNYIMLQQLFEYNQTNQLELYRNVFNDFILQKNMAGSFSFTVYSHPGSFLIYPLCSCSLSDTDLHKIHSTLHECKCHCLSGKIYIALRQAYEIAYCHAHHKKTSSLSGWQISDFYRHNQMSDDIFIMNPFINWIENVRCRFTKENKSILRNYTGWGIENSCSIGRAFIQNSISDSEDDSDDDSEDENDSEDDLQFSDDDD